MSNFYLTEVLILVALLISLGELMLGRIFEMENMYSRRLIKKESA